MTKIALKFLGIWSSSKLTAIEKWVVSVSAAFVTLEFILGYGLGFMKNTQCFRYFGCNAGFFGYDALVHFTGSILEIAIVMWIMEKYPRTNLLTNNFWKNLLLLVAIEALLGISWELLELSFDQLRIYVLHMNLLFPTNHLAQASNTDTMGDLSFGILGALYSSSFLLCLHHDTKK